MLLNEIINNSIAAIEKRRKAEDNRSSEAAYSKALERLELARCTLDKTIKISMKMKEKDIVSTVPLDIEIRKEIMDSINDCGQAIEEKSLTLDRVTVLYGKINIAAEQIKIIWKSATGGYSDGIRGYLNTISSLTNNPKQAKELSDRIKETVLGEPSVKAIDTLIADVEEAKAITEEFKMDASIEGFLKKVSANTATLSDLTPGVLSWLNEKKLTSKINITF